MSVNIYETVVRGTFPVKGERCKEEERVMARVGKTKNDFHKRLWGGSLMVVDTGRNFLGAIIPAQSQVNVEETVGQFETGDNGVIHNLFAEATIVVDRAIRPRRRNPNVPLRLTIERRRIAP